MRLLVNVIGRNGQKGDRRNDKAFLPRRQISTRTSPWLPRFQIELVFSFGFLYFHFALISFISCNKNALKNNSRLKSNWFFSCVRFSQSSCVNSHGRGYIYRRDILAKTLKLSQINGSLNCVLDFWELPRLMNCNQRLLLNNPLLKELRSSLLLKQTTYVKPFTNKEKLIPVWCGMLMY